MVEKPVKDAKASPKVKDILASLRGMIRQNMQFCLCGMFFVVFLFFFY